MRMMVSWVNTSRFLLMKLSHEKIYCGAHMVEVSDAEKKDETVISPKLKAHGYKKAGIDSRRRDHTYL